MNLNKYDSQGFLYTEEEAHERAVAIFQPRYLCQGYKREVCTDLDSKAFGMPIPEPLVKPYNIGRNANKRAAKAAGMSLRRYLK